MVASATEFTVYGYSPGTVVATHFKNGQQTSQITCTMNAAGQCVQSKTVSAWENKTFVYEYNAAGRLVKRYNKNAVNERHEYAYNADGELAVLKTFDSGNMKGFEILFGYSVPNEGLLLDRYRLNSTFLAPLDEYLPIWGSFNKHLVRRITYKACGANDVVEYLCAYSLNSDGLVSEKSLINMANNSLVSKTAFVYSGYGLLAAN
ncbi:hypothetical protein GCM10027299_28190 [Larkinella ripae]